MNIAILGSGHVGQTLAEGLRDCGHQVTIASRSGDKLAEFSGRTGIPERTFQEAAAAAELVVLAVQGAVAQELVSRLASELWGPGCRHAVHAHRQLQAPGHRPLDLPGRRPLPAVSVWRPHLPG